MERIHYIIGIVVFIILSCAALGDQVLTRSERIVALTILGEARGEGEDGMYAIACVIEKRMQESTVNHTAAEVCLQPYQFSVWNAGKGKVKKESQLYGLWKSKSKDYARQLARVVCDKDKNLQHSVIGYANHYHRYDASPSWTKKVKPVAKVKNHYFFKLPWASNKK
tara:strand:+ start:902 stop:1402 length:501 start_codon:yes stop_codon:yes gene_type:complete